MTRPIVITGMHRSGTSMVARAALEAGIHLGHPDELVPGAPDNPDGFFEHAGLVAASDALFQELGAGWDCPPSLGHADLAGPGLAAARDLARPILDELGAHASWAWKDPRVAPVLPFWLDLVDDLGVVLCLRNPLEVAASLRARNGTSLALGLRLWFQHTDAVVASDAPRLVTHYDAWFHRPDDEIARLAAFAGLDPPLARAAAAAAVPARHQRHARFDAPALRAARVDRRVRDLYTRLCAEAGWPDGGQLAPSNGDATMVDAIAPDSPLGQVRAWVVDVGLARHEVHRRNGRVAQLEQRLAASPLAVPEAPGAVETRGQAQEQIQGTLYDLQLQVAELTARVTNGIDAETRATDIAYARMIRALRSDIRDHVPPDATVLVITEGEPALLDLFGRDARAFPPGPTPLLPGSHPRDGVEAATHLTVQQAAGATHLVVPATGAWWLAGYPELAERIATATTAVPTTAPGSLVVRLHGPRQPDRVPDVARAVDVVRRRLGRQPHVLDTTHDSRGPHGSFRPPDDSARLPYLDASVDVVVVDADAVTERVADARRVAATAILTGTADGWTIAWTSPPPHVPADIVVAADDIAAPAAYLDVLRASLPEGHDGAVTVVTSAVGRWTADRDCSVTGGALGDVLAELAAADRPGPVVLVDGATIPLDGWLQPLLAAFGRGPSVGVVSARRSGEPDDGLVRRVDDVAPGALVWPREVLRRHPITPADGPFALALATHCRALAAAGLEALVQPAAVVATLAGDLVPTTSPGVRVHQ